MPRIKTADLETPTAGRIVQGESIRTIWPLTAALMDSAAAYQNIRTNLADAFRGSLGTHEATNFGICNRCGTAVVEV